MSKNHGSSLSLFIRFFVWLNRWFTRGLGAQTSLHEAMWLGLLSGDELQRLADAQYTASRTYNQLEYNLSGMGSWEKSCVEKYFKGCKSVLIAAAGAGREAIAFHQAGFSVEAFDCCPGLVETSTELLRSQAVPVTIRLAPPDVVPEDLGVFDSLVIGWGGYSHIMQPEKRLAFLRQCRQHMKPGAPMLLSFVFCRHDYWRIRLVFHVARAFSIFRPARQPVHLGDHLTLEGFPCFLHYFSRKEIHDELQAAGFSVEFYSDSDNDHAVARNPLLPAAEQSTGAGSQVEVSGLR